MNNFEKGRRFEDRVFRIIKEALANGDLGLSCPKARVFQGKGYYSKDRDSYVKVDISIEVWLPEATGYSFLWVCECKDYSQSIPVDDVEEFKAKLDQIAGKNIKGVVATQSAFQIGALSYAMANGIGVMRILPDDKAVWTAHVQSSHTGDGNLNDINCLIALTNPDFYGKNNSVFAAINGHFYEDILFFLVDWIRDIAKSR